MTFAIHINPFKFEKLEHERFPHFYIEVITYSRGPRHLMQSGGDKALSGSKGNKIYTWRKII